MYPVAKWIPRGSGSYAKTDCQTQNEESGGQTLQDNSGRQSVARPCGPPAFVGVKVQNASTIAKGAVLDSTDKARVKKIYRSTKAANVLHLLRKKFGLMHGGRGRNLKQQLGEDPRKPDGKCQTTARLCRAPQGILDKAKGYRGVTKLSLRQRRHNEGEILGLPIMNRKRNFRNCGSANRAAGLALLQPFYGRAGCVKIEIDRKMADLAITDEGTFKAIWTRLSPIKNGRPDT